MTTADKIMILVKSLSDNEFNRFNHLYERIQEDRRLEKRSSIIKKALEKYDTKIKVNTLKYEDNDTYHSFEVCIEFDIKIFNCDAMSFSIEYEGDDQRSSHLIKWVGTTPDTFCDALLSKEDFNKLI